MEYTSEKEQQIKIIITIKLDCVGFEVLTAAL
jgi:hypothetical protein